MKCSPDPPVGACRTETSIIRPCLWLVMAVLCLLGAPEVGSTTEGGSPLPDRVLFYDADYSVVYGGNMEPARQYFTARGFVQMGTPELLDWIARRVRAGTCAGSVVLAISDVTPKALIEPAFEQAPLFLYCQHGGRYVAPGGTTLYAFEGETDFTISNQGSGTPENDNFLTRMFGVHRVYALRGKGRKGKTAAAAWGLADQRWINSLQTGVPPEDVTVAFAQSEDDAAALAWL